MKKKTNLSIGLDLGTGCAKALLLEQGKNHPLLKEFKQFSLSENGKALPREKYLEVLKSELSSWMHLDAEIKIAISGKDVIVRYLEMPKMNLNELMSSLTFEADRYLPFKLSDAYFDVHILKESSGDATNKMWVVLVATKKEIVDQKLELLNKVDIYPSVMELVPISLINAYTTFLDDKKESQIALLIDIGAKSTVINVLEGKIPYFSREIDFGGDHVTSFLAKKNKIDFNEAEKLKIDKKIDWEEADVLKLFGDCVKAIKTAIDYYEGKADKVIDNLLLSGGSAQLQGLSDFLKKDFNRSVEIFNPVKNLKKSEGTPEISENLPAFTVATGLALQEVEV